MPLLISISLAFALVGGDTVEFVPARPDDGLEMVSFLGDTLTFLTCGDHLFEPFGPLESAAQLSLTTLRQFRIDTLRRADHKFYRLTRGTSYLILFLKSDSEGARTSYVLKGRITDPDVLLIPGVSIGTSLKDFYAAFFKRFPDTWLNVRTIIFESCLVGDRETFNMVDGRLSEVQFHCWDCIPEFQF